MAHRVFFLNTLRDGVNPADYENWVRRTDYPVARNHPSVLSYQVTKVESTLDGSAASMQYLEVLEISSIEEYLQALETPEFKDLLAEWSTYVGSSEAVHGGVIE